MLKLFSIRRGAAIGLLIAGGLVGCCAAFAVLQSTGAIAAEVRRGPPREAFKSGGERAVEVLEVMAASLARIEKRLDSIERTIAGLKADEQN